MRNFSIGRGVMVAALLALAGQAAAEPLDYRSAKRQLFPARMGAMKAVVLRPDLVPEALKPALTFLLTAKPEDIKRRGIPVPPNAGKYYSAAAFSPSRGAMDKALALAFNFHSSAAAGAAAEALCNAQIEEGDAPCVTAIIGVPKAWKQDRAFSLNLDATAAFRGAYARAPRPRAFAISASTAHWGMGTGANAAADAVAACAAKGAEDCAVVAAD